MAGGVTRVAAVGGGQGADRLGLYDDTARRAADVVVRRYSTSFGLATRLLPPGQRGHVRNVYALVRLADEVVDGASAEAGADVERSRGLLDDLEQRTESAMASGYSTDVLVHAFAITAREVGITTDLTRPFFASMRTDLDVTVHDEASLADYVYGSAEVVGLMCLRVFLHDEADRDRRFAELTPGARALGAAFQKINFLRDLAEDGAVLGRQYLVGLDPRHVTEEAKATALAEIDADLRVARTALVDLPSGPRRAVGVAYGLFAELAARIRATPAEELGATRVRVPSSVKARIAATAVLRASLAGSHGGRSRR
ncbi:squalene/phytoene synthase family protein [Actinotalea sp. M2MS4P-6]|uniref:phytoene/squalene synthase family protein n=1 Tax=Actinotalea sp. M2MS4P-6 TaxID=2983762 RepID=UPI0021E3ED98|nr:squalene/phytoene synthase family protein [Actinotalea sp. M2MS4P-6]MCV2393026.1 squalene/phytoene synthase family protein [Actinotalea sp. M2MS4P-6]